METRFSTYGGRQSQTNQRGHYIVQELLSAGREPGIEFIIPRGTKPRLDQINAGFKTKGEEAWNNTVRCPLGAKCRDGQGGNERERRGHSTGPPGIRTYARK